MQRRLLRHLIFMQIMVSGMLPIWREISQLLYGQITPFRTKKQTFVSKQFFKILIFNFCIIYKLPFRTQCTCESTSSYTCSRTGVLGNEYQTAGSAQYPRPLPGYRPSHYVSNNGYNLQSFPVIVKQNEYPVFGSGGYQYMGGQGYLRVSHFLISKQLKIYYFKTIY